MKVKIFAHTWANESLTEFENKINNFLSQGFVTFRSITQSESEVGLTVIITYI